MHVDVLGGPQKSACRRRAHHEIRLSYSEQNEQKDLVPPAEKPGLPQGEEKASAAVTSRRRRTSLSFEDKRVFETAEEVEGKKQQRACENEGAVEQIERLDYLHEEEGGVDASNALCNR